MLHETGEESRTGEQGRPEVRPGASPAQLRLADALGGLCRLIPQSQAAVSAQLHVAKSTLTGYLKADRVPDDRLLADLHALAEQAARSAGTAAPVPVERLLQLADAARIRHCPCCPDGAPGRELSALTGSAAPEGDALQDAVAPAGAPVPAAARTGAPAGADRQHGSATEAGPVVAELARHLREGRVADARTLMHHAGSALQPPIVARFVSAARRTGFHEAADTVLHHAARRGAQPVLELAALLAAEGRLGDVQVLLGAAQQAVVSL